MLSNYIRARKVRSWEVKAGNGVVQTWDHKMPEKWADPDPSVIRGFLAKGGNPLEADAKHGLSVLHHVARQNPNPENLTRLLEEGLPLDW